MSFVLAYLLSFAGLPVIVGLLWFNDAGLLELLPSTVAILVVLCVAGFFAFVGANLWRVFMGV